MKSTSFAGAAAVVLLGSLMASSAAIWIRYLPGVSPLVIGYVRVGGAALILLPWFWLELVRRGPLAWPELRFSALAGVALALHFATWIASLRYTTVAHSVLFVATHPMFVIAISLWLLRVPVARNQVVGAVVALAGVVFIQWQELGGGSHGGGASAALGNLLALAGGLFAAIYLLLGQEARRGLSTIIHVEVTYATAAVVLLLMALAFDVPGPPRVSGPWLYLALLVLLPTVGGHTIFNWGLRHLGAPLVSLFGLLEPVESTLLALLILGEAVPPTTALGAAVILGGLGLAIWRPQPPATQNT